MKINEKLLQSISNGNIVIKNEQDKIKLSELNYFYKFN